MREGGRLNKTWADEKVLINHVYTLMFEREGPVLSYLFICFLVSSQLMDKSNLNIDRTTCRIEKKKKKDP